MQICKMLTVILSMTVMAFAADETNYTCADGNGHLRSLNLRPSQDTESLRWLEEQPSKLNFQSLSVLNLPSEYSSRNNCSPIWNQEDLGSCTGFASKSAGN